MRCLTPWLPAALVAATALAASPPGDSIADAQLASWADARVKERQPTARERRIDEIGWAQDIRAARALSKKTRRPVFLFTMDGRISIGRC
jgi:hypothetical protein